MDAKDKQEILDAIKSVASSQVGVVTRLDRMEKRVVRLERAKGVGLSPLWQACALFVGTAAGAMLYQLIMHSMQ